MGTGIKGSDRNAFIIDLLAVLFLTACVFFLAFGYLNNSCQWGDDFAAYINQGIAIAEGTFDEQVYLNHLMHPSFMPDEAADGKLVYVWGYSLLHALVYKLVGFDRVNFSSLIYYKLPTVIALALMAAVLYLFLRRRFGAKLSFFMTAMFCTYGEFYIFLDSIISDLAFLFFALLAFYLCELFLSSEGNRKIVRGIIWGICLWFMYEFRLNGIAIVFTCALAHLMQLLSKSEKSFSFSRLSAYIRQNKKQVFTELLPYILFFALRLISESILAPATSNASDLSETSLSIIYGNTTHYLFLIRTWFRSMWSNIISTLLLLGFVPTNSLVLFHVVNTLSYISVILCVVGIIFDGIKRNLHYTVFLAIYLFFVSMLFYNMGIRYIFPLLPIVMMYTGYGFMRVIRLISLPDKVKSYGKYVLCVLVAVLCFGFAYPQFVQAKTNIASGFSSTDLPDSENAYSPSAIEAYKYVNDNIPEDSLVGYFKPRALYLNTQRKAVALTSLLDNKLEDVDYYLIYKNMILDPEPTEDFVKIWENNDFIMMEKQNR